MHTEVVPPILSCEETLVPPPSAQGTAWRHEAATTSVIKSVFFLPPRNSYVLPLVVPTKNSKAINYVCVCI
jgi:hypothetical protein